MVKTMGDDGGSIWQSRSKHIVTLLPLWLIIRLPIHTDYWTNAPLIVLPEGVRFDFLQPTEHFNWVQPINSNLYPSTFGLNPQYFSCFQAYMSEKYAELIAPVLDLNKLANMSLADLRAQFDIPTQMNLQSYVAQAASKLNSATESARIEAEKTVKQLNINAENERGKALYAMLLLERKYSGLPPLPPQGFAKEPAEVTINRWVNERRIAEAEVTRLAQNAVNALEEALRAQANLAILTQAAATSQEQSQLALQAASQFQTLEPSIPTPSEQPIFTSLSCPPEIRVPSNIDLPTPIIEPAIPESAFTPKASVGEQFANLIIAKIEEMKDPAYIENLPKVRPLTSEWFGNHIAQNLEEQQAYYEYLKDPLFSQTMYEIEQKFKIEDPLVPADNYASTLAQTKPSSPFYDVPLLGFPNQCTLHYHCGISNNFTSVVEAGLTLGASLDQSFAVQPHLIHSSNLIDGLVKVGLEQLDKIASEIDICGLGGLNRIWGGEIPSLILENSKIGESIQYEVATLQQIATAIIATGKENLKQVHVTFSNGGALLNYALDRLSPEERDTIIVITTGTTEIISSDKAFLVYNLIGDKDTPSHICNGGMSGIEKARDRADVQIIKQTETRFFEKGHYFLQPDYQERISKLIKTEIANKYEIH